MEKPTEVHFGSPYQAAAGNKQNRKQREAILQSNRQGGMTFGVTASLCTYFPLPNQRCSPDLQS